MASISLYPPVLENTLPAFLVTDNDDSYCRVYFNLSKLSTYEGSIRSVHVSVINQKTGQSVVNKVDNISKQRYRKTGIIIINKPPVAVTNSNNLYYVDILNEDIKDRWQPGTIYKIQIRLSTILYIQSSNITQSVWLRNNAGNFSEWSSYCITKATSKPTIKIPVLQGFDSSEDIVKNNATKYYNFSSSSTIELNGTYRNEEDTSEILYSYQFQLYEKSDDENNIYGDLYEDSGVIYAEQYSDQEQTFYYLIKRDLESGFGDKVENENALNKRYILKFSYSTINGLTGSYVFDLNILKAQDSDLKITPYTIENAKSINDNGNFLKEMEKLTSIPQEMEEGRIGLKLYSNNQEKQNLNICLRRADSREEYKVWTDIKIITCFDKSINELDIIYDNTIESGVQYRYGAQIIDTNGERKAFEINTTPVQREFEYSYLVGEGGRQLKLKYNNSMNNYTYNYSDSKTDTIGGKYPYITRNGNMMYRSFPINGLITFNMDDSNLFIPENYSSTDFCKYDYKKEFDFREKVLAFLQDSKPKLFKSATEGNIIVRLMNVAAQPEQSLNRMIYSFTANAYEIADNTMENYLKYNFYSVGNYVTSFAKYETKIGQLDIDFLPNDNSNVLNNDIIGRIWEKYDLSNYNITDTKVSLKRIHHVRINFESRPLKVKNSGNEYILGYNLLYNNDLITVNAKYSNIYEFDENITFDEDSILLIQGDEDNYTDKEKTVVHLNIDFLYDIETDVYKKLERKVDTVERGIGQLYNNYPANKDLYRELILKHNFNSGDRFREIGLVEWTCIETTPGAVFALKDAVDSNDSNDRHEINETGILNLEGIGSIKSIVYLGIRNKNTGEIEQKNCDIMVDYMYTIEEGYYS